MATRRQALKYCLASTSLVVPGALAARPVLSQPAFSDDPWPETFEIVRTEEEWRRLLPGPQYLVLREQKTEIAYVSHLNDEYRPGVYHCAGCDLEVYSSAHKYDSKTGWPSFTQAIDGSTLTRDESRGFGFKRQEVCRRCGSHLGHIFDDGPPPMGYRHCINGLALKFTPA